MYELLFIRHEGDELELEVHCSKGTYIRTIIDDLGEKLGCGAHVIYLRRLAVSTYPVERMVTLEHLRELVEQAEAQQIAPADLLDPLLMPMDSPAADFPVVNLPLTSSVYFKNGNPVRTTSAPSEGLVRVTEGDEGKFIGMGEMDGEGASRRVAWSLSIRLKPDSDNGSPCDKQGRRVEYRGLTFGKLFNILRDVYWDC